MKVKVVIPIYKSTLSELESKSLNQACLILSKYQLAFIKPESLDLKEISAKYPQIEIECFDDKYFSNILGYNHLMLSADFYSRFLTSDYILIYQLDAYVFRDELYEWCQKGYDYVGAPWVEKPIYRFAIMRQWRRMKKRIRIEDKPAEEITAEKIEYNRMLNERIAARKVNEVGNGGFSLRKVASHYNTILNSKETVDFYLAQEFSHHFNEDVFWASEPKQFHYPPLEEALTFSFDKYPGLCYKKNKKQLPFGCHGWYKKRAIKFWKPIIGF